MKITGTIGKVPITGSIGRLRDVEFYVLVEFYALLEFNTNLLDEEGIGICGETRNSEDKAKADLIKLLDDLGAVYEVTE
jgi:hypothetical protein